MNSGPVRQLEQLRIEIHRFGETHAPLSAEQREPVKLALGEMLLTLIRSAERLDIDLIRAAEDKVQLRAANLPTLVKLGKDNPGAR